MSKPLDEKNAAEVRRDVLCAIARIAARAAVAERDVEQAVGAELQAAGVVHRERLLFREVLPDLRRVGNVGRLRPWGSS